MGRDQTLMIVIVLILTFAFVPLVYAGALSVGESGSTDIVIGQGTENQLTRTTQAANVTITDIDTSIETTHWSAFLGNITASIALTGGENQGIFEFDMNASNLDAIAATTDANFDWGNLQTVIAPDVDSLLNISTTAADSATSAFNTTDSYLGVSGLITQILRNSTALDDNWGTSIGADTGTIQQQEKLDNLVFIGVLNEGEQTENFMGGTAEYQMIVGVNETDTPGLDVEVTYNFWLIETQGG